MPGPNKHARYSRTGTIPFRDMDSAPDPNWMKGQRQPLLDTPWTILEAADLVLTSGAPGAVATYQWQPVTNPIYDQYNICGPVATENLRIPWDGIYDIWGSCAFITVASVFEWSSILQSAPTSNSGFGAPVFANTLSIPGSNERNYFQNNLAAPVIAPRISIQHTAVPLFANDMIRYQAQVSSASNKTSRFEYFVVRWVSPIPNNMLTIMPNHV